MEKFEEKKEKFLITGHCFFILKMGETQHVKIGFNFSLFHLPLKASE